MDIHFLRNQLIIHKLTIEIYLDNCDNFNFLWTQYICWDWHGNILLNVVLVHCWWCLCWQKYVYSKWNDWTVFYLYRALNIISSSLLISWPAESLSLTAWNMNFKETSIDHFAVKGSLCLSTIQWFWAQPQA